MGDRSGGSEKPGLRRDARHDLRVNILAGTQRIAPLGTLDLKAELAIHPNSSGVVGIDL